MGQAASMAIGETKPSGNWADYVRAYPEKLGKAAPVMDRSAIAPNIAITTASVLKSREESRFPKQEPGEDFKSFGQRERDATMSVALNQPHRQGSHDPRLGEPLYLFVAAHGLAFSCYRAGEEYDQVLRRAKVARGFRVPGNIPPIDPAFLTPAQIEAIREASIMHEHKISAILRAVMPRLPRVLERICFDRLEPSPYDHGIIRHGLAILAVEFGFLDRGINAEKPI